MVDILDRMRGMMVGLAVGDALGAPVEFLPEPSDVHISSLGDEIAHFHDNLRLPAGVWTDDTEMALCLADSLLVCKGYDSYDIMMKFTAWVNHGYRTYDGRPAVDVGFQTMRAIEDFEREPVIFENNTTESAGNGAIMRLAPVVIAGMSGGGVDGDSAGYGDDAGFDIDVDTVARLAVLSCRETHNSETAEMVTKIFAEVLCKICQGWGKKEIGEYIDSKMVIEKDGSRLSNLGGYIVDTFAIAVFGLMNYDNFYDGMMAVIRLGGDTDTNGACYGQLAGAYYGYDLIPEEWRANVYLADELVKIADKLFKMGGCPVIRTRFEDDDTNPFSPDIDKNYSVL